MNKTTPLHIVLVEPEIPPNTGNIARLCACTGCQLHLVHPLGFDLSDKMVRRAGLDYWEWLDVQEYEHWAAVRHALRDAGQWYAFSTKAVSSLWDVRYQPGDVLVFGPETRGLPEAIRQECTALRLPMRQDAPVRSLNLSSACAVACYEGLRSMAQHDGGVLG
ncbi:MAG: tRNA (cytidine(34)-2'-O)-methyltransferase [Mariprofundaceae bacterium]|nr:tRNA (cytidine(34)-2'-O)-methyltransferase [Mariprofundaceae bacterium]